MQVCYYYCRKTDPNNGNVEHIIIYMMISSTICIHTYMYLFVFRILRIVSDLCAHMHAVSTY